MADFTRLIEDFTEAAFRPTLEDLQRVLPASFFLVEYGYFPDVNSYMTLKHITASQAEAERWVAECVRDEAETLREEGLFPVRGEEIREQVRIWIDVVDRDDNDRPATGLMFRIIPATPADVAQRLIG